MTSNEWIKCKISDLGNVIGGSTPSTKDENNYGGNISWITPKDLSTFNERYIYKGERNITEKGLKSCSTQLMPKNSILFTSRAPIGYVAIAGKEVCTNQGFKSIIPNENTDYLFLYYLLKYNKENIENMGSGTTFKEVSGSTMRNIEVTVPKLKSEQQKIAKVLSAIDDKIELNNSINNNLEQQAQAIFKSWFVDVSDSNNSSEKFGKFPQLATELTVGDIEMLVTDYVANGSFASLKENVTLYQEPNYAYFVRNTDLKTNTFNVFVDEHSYKFLSKSTLYGNEIIISNVGDVGSVFLCPNLDLPMTLGNNIIMLRPKDNRLTYYLYIWFKWSYGQNLMQGIKGGSAQPKFNKTDFKSLPIIIPQGKLLDKFSDIMTPIFNSIEKNNKENKFLIQLRDTLLPKLMSGEIDVSNVDISIDKLLLNEG